MDKVPILFIIAPLLLPCMSERLNFHQYKPATWDEARKHCQVCYTELVTVSYDNSLALVRGVKGQQWIGLREKLWADPWSGWANGDPITFQNWYPGEWQTVEETTTAIAAVPETSTSDFTQTPSNDTLKTAFTIAAVSETSGFTQTYYDDTTSLKTTKYVREACVAMLDSGTWVEEDCAKELPYICYEDRFYGNISVDRNATTATLSWSSANVSSYRVEVQGGVKLNDSVTGLTYDLFNMTPGTPYAVRVFPVKCDRELNSQNISFITKPEPPRNLTIVNVTENSVVLLWDRPVGNLQSYCVKVRGGSCRNTSQQQQEVPGLIPGGRYAVYVLSRAVDVWSEPANIIVFTRPSQVTGLLVPEVTNQSLKLSWSHAGNALKYRVVAVEIRNNTNFEFFRRAVKQDVKWVQVTGALPGTHLGLTVWALAHGDLESDGVTMESFLTPDPVPSLVLNPTSYSIHASWPLPTGSYQFFRVSVQLHDSTMAPNHSDTTTTSLALDKLLAAAKYEVTVSTHAGNLKSAPVVNSCYTVPVQPVEFQVSKANDSHVTLTWRTPSTAPTTEHRVKYNGSFWNHHGVILPPRGQTSLTVGGLRPCSRYEFEVFTVSDSLHSRPANLTHITTGKKSEVTLSMMCSSAAPLLCEGKATKEDVLKELKNRFGVLLDGVSWELKWKD